MSHLRNSKNDIAIVAIMFVAYLLFFIPVIKSWYMYDDRLNYAVKGYALMHNQSIWEMTYSFAKHWLLNEGRTFIFAWYGYALFQIVNVISYKILIVVFTFLNGLLLSRMTCKLNSNKRIGYLMMALFPVLVSLNCSYHNAIYGFHMLIQTAFMLSLLSILCFINYLEKHRRRSQVASCIFLFFALGTYEVSYVLCLIFFIISMAATPQLHKAIKIIVPQIIVGLCWMVANIYFARIAPHRYNGIAVAISDESIWGLLKQISGSTCVVSNIINLSLIDENRGVIYGNMLRYIAVSVIAIALCCFIVSLFSKKKASETITKELSLSNKSLAYIGIWLIIGPSLLIAISKRYQTEVMWGMGYLPAYVSAWGVALCIALIMEVLLSNLKNKKGLLAISSLLIVTTLVPNQMVADITTEMAHGDLYSNKDKMFRAAMQTGLFDDWHENDDVLDATGFIEPENHYSYLLGYKVNVTPVSSLYTVNEEGVVKTDKYEYFKEVPSFWYVAFPNESCVFQARGTDVQIDEQGNYAVYAQQFFVFIPLEQKYKSVTVHYEGGRIETVDFNDGNRIRTSDSGSVYLIETDEPVNIVWISVNT